MCCFQVKISIGVHLMVSTIYTWYLNGYQFMFLRGNFLSASTISLNLIIKWLSACCYLTFKYYFVKILAWFYLQCDLYNSFCSHVLCAFYVLLFLLFRGFSKHFLPPVNSFKKLNWNWVLKTFSICLTQKKHIQR